MKITYSTKAVEGGTTSPAVHLNCNNEHIGTIFGTVSPGEGDFEKNTT